MSNETQRKEVLMRLKRIEGQVRGIQRMIEGGLPCRDILAQVAAATAATKKVGAAIVQSYMEECLNKAGGSRGKRGETVRDFQKAVSQYIDWA